MEMHEINNLYALFSSAMILLLQSSVFESVSPKIARDIWKVICDNFGIFLGMQREFTNQIELLTKPLENAMMF